MQQGATGTIAHCAARLHHRGPRQEHQTNKTPSPAWRDAYSHITLCSMQVTLILLLLLRFLVSFCLLFRLCLPSICLCSQLCEPFQSI